jgi:hypothetical protein
MLIWSAQRRRVWRQDSGLGPKFCGCSSVVEHLLAKERVESSNLFIRFQFTPKPCRSVHQAGILGGALLSFTRLAISLGRPIHLEKTLLTRPCFAALFSTVVLLT